jgi:pyrimidine dimer DNA glycosylase
MQVLLGLRWDNGRGVIEPYTPKGWRTHPVVLMWRGFEPVLDDYQRAVCAEWVRRGFRDTCSVKTTGLLLESGVARSVGAPAWLGHPPLHLSHQSNLVRKDPAIYAERFPGVPHDLPYVWPVQVGASEPADST